MNVELTNDERRLLGCYCWRLDNIWHHKRGCAAPLVEIILTERAKQTESVQEENE